MNIYQGSIICYLYRCRVSSSMLSCPGDVMSNECSPVTTSVLTELIHTLLWLELGNIQFNQWSDSCEIFKDFQDDPTDLCKYQLRGSVPDVLLQIMFVNRQSINKRATSYELQYVYQRVWWYFVKILLSYSQLSLVIPG